MTELYDIDWDDADDVVAAARGEYGDEEQAQALQVLGLEFAGEEESEEGDPETEAFILHQAERLEQSLGRPLSTNEFGHVAQELLSGADPGATMAAIGQALQNRTREDHGSSDLMREHFQDAKAEAEEAEQGYAEDNAPVAQEQ